MNNTEAEAQHTGLLVVVATPIGNLGDITYRAVETLREADLILAEDTRRSRVLLNHYNIETPLRAFHAHSNDGAIESALGRLLSGQTLALITDAGTPLVSDPGVRLVAAAKDANVTVTSAPGVSAPITALTLAGLRADHFRFIGFLPRGKNERHTFLVDIAARREATILFESPKRLRKLLALMSEMDALSNRRIAVCRELTKRHEEVLRGTPLEVLLATSEQPRGEITIVVEAKGAEDIHVSHSPEELANEGLSDGRHPRQIAKAIAALTELSSKEAYALVLALKNSKNR